MSHPPTRHVVAFNHSGEAATLGSTDYVDELHAVKDIRSKRLPDLDLFIRRDLKLSQNLAGDRTGILEACELRLVNARLLLLPES